ncbi:MAG: MFS transporter [Candidatus Hodarchaeota archaeon]
MVGNKYLGIEEIPRRAQHYIRTYLVFQTFSTLLLFLSNTFFVLFSIDKIGFALTGVTLSFTFLIQLLFDYPSGSLGDWIGQRWVLSISFACYGIAFFLMTTAQTFTNFMIIAFFNGFGNAQNSGAINTWLDNNYQKVIEQADPERKAYGFSRARVLTMTRVASAVAFMTGGFLATQISRQFVFGLQAIFALIIIIPIYILVRDEKIDESLKINTSNQSSSNSYLAHLVGGVKFLISSKAPFFFITGTALIFASFAIWGSLILLPLYFGYAGSDDIAATLRTSAFVIGVPISLYIAKISQRFQKDQIPLLTFLFVFLFYPGFILVITLIPITNELNLAGCIITVIWLNALIPTLFDLGTILRQRVMLDLVPSENRNAVYSLIPTIISSMGIFLLPISGVIIESYGLTMGIFVAFSVAIVSAIFIALGIHFHELDTKSRIKMRGIQARESIAPGT